MAPVRVSTLFALLLLASFTVPVTAMELNSDSSQAKVYLDAPDFESMEDFFGWIDEAGYTPISAGSGYNVLRDPDAEYRYFFVIERDSSGWIQNPSGEMTLLDPYAMWRIGTEAAKRMGYDSLRYEGVGYGWEDGRVYFEVAQSAPVYWSIAGLMVVLIGGGAGLWVLAAKLRQATIRGEQLADSRRRLADSREAERLRLARELHDGPLQDLQAVRMQLGMAGRAERGGDGAPAASPLDAAVTGVQDEVLRVISELREISEGLRPPVLSSFGLGAAVRAFAERFRTTNPDVSFEIHFDDAEGDLADGVRLALYRIVQESLNNALRHGHPASIEIHCRIPDDGLVLSIVDDGAGMVVPADLHDLEREGHLGLAGMAERAESIGGTLRVTSRPGRTRVEARVPSRLLSLTPSNP